MSGVGRAYHRTQIPNNSVPISTASFVYFTTVKKQVQITYINHARWHRCLCSCGLGLEEYRNTRRKPTCMTFFKMHNIIEIEICERRNDQVYEPK